MPPTRESAREFGAPACGHPRRRRGGVRCRARRLEWAGLFRPALATAADVADAGTTWWGEFYADERLTPMAEMAAPRLSPDGRARWPPW